MVLDRTEFTKDAIRIGTSSGVIFPKEVCDEYPVFEADKPLVLKVVEGKELHIELWPYKKP